MLECVSSRYNSPSRCSSKNDREPYWKLFSHSRTTNLSPSSSQLAFTLGELKDAPAGKALAHIATNYLTNAEIRAAVMSSAIPHGAALLEAVATLPPESSAGREWLDPLIATAVGTKDETMLARALQTCLPAPGTAHERQVN